MTRWLLVFVAAVCLWSEASAQVVRMALLTAPPYGALDSEGRASGLYPDIAQALEQATGLDVQVELVPFARAANEVAKGGADATIMMANAFSDGKAVEAVVVFYTRQVLLLRPGLQLGVDRSLNGLTIGRLNGGCQALAERTGAAVKFQEINSQASAVGMLALGRIDAFCSTEEAIRAEIRNQGLEAKLRAAKLMELGARPVWLMLSPTLAPAVAEKLVAGVKRLQKSGQLATIFRNHLGSAYRLQTQEKTPF
ncbi:transporter substrate-binding domain-containing protein [Curvibacter sp. APW13]|uniref:substrate-binding periplasmic protein n=1 Tax=Curvibacter sp. APW13 TaxID=3077236 RepID=UPI0028DD84F5|nr:transporter substrate-binding domain-containing protein [Curvibacter sp. APW13]MDT8991140.1 transporter substrate-binding domain-containing protein [Curvibacter sp. APW13]